MELERVSALVVLQLADTRIESGELGLVVVGARTKSGKIGTYGTCGLVNISALSLADTRTKSGEIGLVELERESTLVALQLADTRTKGGEIG